MSVAEFPMSGFDQFMREQNLSEDTRRQMLVAVRRAAKHVGPERLDDPQMLAYYRASLSPALRAVFGCAWSKFVRWAAAQGFQVAETVHIPRTRLLHPLMPDMTDILACWAPARVVLLRWGDSAVEEATDEAHTAAMRVYEFITGHTPIKGDCLIPFTRRDEDPMPEWLLESILRSDQRQTEGTYEKFAGEVILNATRRGITAHQLRTLYAQLWLSRHGLARSSGTLRKLKKILANEKDCPWADSIRHFDNLCGSLPANHEPIIYW